MDQILYVYDCKQSRQMNARRVTFTKRLFGVTYSWKTKSGFKQKRKLGLIEKCPGATIISDSAILVPINCKSDFDSLFQDYSDIVSVHAFRVSEEVKLFEHVF